MAAILDFNRKWIIFRLPPYLKLKILLKTMFLPSFMLVPQKAVFFDMLQLSAGLLELYQNLLWAVVRFFGNGPSPRFAYQWPDNMKMYKKAKCHHYIPCGSRVMIIFTN